MDIDFVKILGISFKDLCLDYNSYTIEKNDFELELEEGLPVKSFVKSLDKTFEMILNKDMTIEVIFLYPDFDGNFPILDLNNEIGKTEIRERMGIPDKESMPSNIPILGFTGGFDRYDKEFISYNFEYLNEEQTKLKKITLMDITIAP